MNNTNEKIYSERQVTQPASLLAKRAPKVKNLAVPPVKRRSSLIVANKENKRNMELLLDTTTAAKRLGVTPRYLRLCAKAGKIDYYKPLGSSKFVFKESDVAKALVRGK